MQGSCESQVGSAPGQPLPAPACGGQGGPGGDRELRSSSGREASTRCSVLGQHSAPDRPAAPSTRTSWAPRERPAVGGTESMTPTVPTRPGISLDEETSKAGTGGPDPTLPTRTVATAPAGGKWPHRGWPCGQRGWPAQWPAREPAHLAFLITETDQGTFAFARSTRKGYISPTK